jgi:hypothetical protein
MERDLIVCAAIIAASDVVDAFPGSHKGTRERASIHAHVTRVIKDTLDNTFEELKDDAAAKQLGAV